MSSRLKTNCPSSEYFEQIWLPHLPNAVLLKTYERTQSDAHAEIADGLEKLTIVWQGIENTREGGSRRTPGLWPELQTCVSLWLTGECVAITEKRITCELELNLRIKPSRRLKRDKPDAIGGRDPDRAG